jgi:hypothetical protein
MANLISGSEATLEAEKSEAEERSTRVTGVPDVSSGRLVASAPVALSPACLLISQDGGSSRFAAGSALDSFDSERETFPLPSSS